MLAACGSCARPPSASACKTALAAQLAASENGSLPRQRSGLAPSVVSSISAQVVQSALARYLKEHRQ
jgi:hypothetical protein